MASARFCTLRRRNSTSAQGCRLSMKLNNNSSPNRPACLQEVSRTPRNMISELKRSRLVDRAADRGSKPLTVDQVRLTVDFDFDHKNRFFCLTSVGEVANLLQRSRKEASVVEVEAEAEDEDEVMIMDEVGILTAATSTTTRKEKTQQEAVGEAIQTRGTINLKEEPSLTIEVRVSSSSAIPLIRKVTSYTTRTTKSL
ncbi:hypothetical protein ACOSQ2_020326 [Xanthoceras sorbifolium]